MIDTLRISRDLQKDGVFNVEQAERIAQAVAAAADDRRPRSLEIQVGIQTGAMVLLTAFVGATFWQVRTVKDRLAETQVAIEARLAAQQTAIEKRLAETQVGIESKLAAQQVANEARFTRIETRLDGMDRTLNAIAAKLGVTP